MLRNGLYLDRLFPAYLFAGQRGCGKTTTARIFAAALNCQELSKFRTAPKSTTVPCLQCPSCIAMLEHNHPDFLEVDAASNTGVDHVRQIMEVANYLPLLGSRKIYLIDEAHMLSKAAFNALLKILEEPPMSVLFMLATTEEQKIPDTVRSRCFHAVFGPIATDALTTHLTAVCEREKISSTREALAVIAEQSGGSVRDALNLLEQVASASSSIDPATVRQTLGIIPAADILCLMQAVAAQDTNAILTLFATRTISTASVHAIWTALAQLLAILVRANVGAPWQNSNFEPERAAIEALAKTIPTNRIYAFMQLFWSFEENFLRTSQKKLLLEHLLIQMGTSAVAQPVPTQRATATATESKKSIATPRPVTQEVASQPAVPKPSAPPIEPPKAVVSAPTAPTPSPVSGPLDAIIAEVATTGDKLLESMLRQVTKVVATGDQKVLELHLPVVSSFVADKIMGSSSLLLPMVIKQYPTITGISLKANVVSTPPLKQPNAQPNPLSRPRELPKRSSIPQALAEAFPGTIEYEK